MKRLRVVSGDPGKTNDPFGVVGLEATWPEKKIYIRYARQFKRKPYDYVARHFVKLLKNNPDIILIEKNFDYENVSKAFSKYNLPIQYVSTTGNLTDKNNAKGFAIDKPFMIGWLKDQYRARTIIFPAVRSADMEELVTQRNSMASITAPSGHVAYKAERGRHDDLFMAKLIGCNAIRIWWDMQ
jgi:hypothetical protein